MNDELELMILDEASQAPLGFRRVHVKDLTAASGIDEQWVDCRLFGSRWSMSRSCSKPISKIVVEP